METKLPESIKKRKEKIKGKISCFVESAAEEFETEEKTKERLTTSLFYLMFIPDFFDSFLFSDEEVEKMGYQIKTKINNSHSRLIFSFYDFNKKKESEGLKEFNKDCFDCFGHEFHKNSKKVEKLPKYELSSYKNDIIPEDLAELIYNKLTKDKDDITLPNFILSLSDKADEWKDHFEKILLGIKKIKKDLDDLYEKLI